MHNTAQFLLEIIPNTKMHIKMSADETFRKLLYSIPSKLIEPTKNAILRANKRRKPHTYNIGVF